MPQMMYDKSGGGSSLRKYLSCNLADWHSYKQATKMIWKGFANTIWARLWHRMYPGSKFNVINPSPQEAAMHMVYMARAYPSCKTELEEESRREAPMKRERLCCSTFSSCASSPSQRSSSPHVCKVTLCGLIQDKHLLHTHIVFDLALFEQ